MLCVDGILSSNTKSERRLKWNGLQSVIAAVEGQRELLHPGIHKTVYLLGVSPLWKKQ